MSVKIDIQDRLETFRQHDQALGKEVDQLAFSTEISSEEFVKILKGPFGDRITSRTLELRVRRMGLSDDSLGNREENWKIGIAVLNSPYAAKIPEGNLFKNAVLQQLADRKWAQCLEILKSPQVTRISSGEARKLLEPLMRENNSYSGQNPDLHKQERKECIHILQQRYYENSLGMPCSIL